MHQTLRRTATGAAALILCLAIVRTVGARSPQQTYNVTLSHAEVSLDEQGRTVMTMMAAGDLSGVITVAAVRDAQGAVTTGEWALNVSYTESVPVEPGEPTSDPDGGERLVQKGAIKGKVEGGTLTFNAEGGLGSLSLVLSVNSGTLQYVDVASGNATVSGSNLADRDASTGALSLIF